MFQCSFNREANNWHVVETLVRAHFICSSHSFGLTKKHIYKFKYATDTIYVERARCWESTSRFFSDQALLWSAPCAHLGTHHRSDTCMRCAFCRAPDPDSAERTARRRVARSPHRPGPSGCVRTGGAYASFDITLNLVLHNSINMIVNRVCVCVCVARYPEHDRRADTITPPPPSPPPPCAVWALQVNVCALVCYTRGMRIVRMVYIGCPTSRTHSHSYNNLLICRNIIGTRVRAIARTLANCKAHGAWAATRVLALRHCCSAIINSRILRTCVRLSSPLSLSLSLSVPVRVCMCVMFITQEWLRRRRAHFARPIRG